MSVKILPHFEAACDIMAALLLLIGFLLVRRGHKEAHKACMLSALLAFAASMGAYAIHKYFAGTIKFVGQGDLRTIYFATLYGHAAAASISMPLVAFVLYRAFRGNFEGHKKAARWTLPIWLFSSLTGFAVYFILFRVAQNGGIK